MSWFQNIFQRDRRSSLEFIQSNFRAFSSLLGKNNLVLKAIADMEEKSDGDYLFDINYINTGLSGIRSGVKEMVGHTVKGPDRKSEERIVCGRAVPDKIYKKGEV